VPARQQPLDRARKEPGIGKVASNLDLEPFDTNKANSKNLRHGRLEQTGRRRLDRNLRDRAARSNTSSSSQHKLFPMLQTCQHFLVADTVEPVR
jgi:hypothetical protein